MLRPICPYCKIEIKVTKHNHRFESICSKCGNRLHDKLSEDPLLRT